MILDLSLSFTYSGDGRRTSSNTNGTVVKYVYDGLTPLIEKDSLNNILATYTKVPSAPGGIGGLISSFDGTNTLYYHDSNLGNVNQITDSSGAVVQTYDYDAFGNITNQTGSLTTKYAYKTKEYSPETGLIFFGARYYNPLIGRFITQDPSGMVDGPNVYVYLNDDPVNKMDPWGLAETWWWMNPSTPPASNVNVASPQDVGIPTNPLINQSPFPQSPIKDPSLGRGIFAGKSFIDFVKAVAEREKYPTWPAVPAPKEEEAIYYPLDLSDKGDCF